MNLGPPHPARAKPVGTGGGQRLLVLLSEFLWVVIAFRSNPPAGLSPDLVAKELDLRHVTRSGGTGQRSRSGPAISTTPPILQRFGWPLPHLSADALPQYRPPLLERTPRVGNRLLGKHTQLDARPRADTVTGRRCRYATVAVCGEKEPLTMIAFLIMRAEAEPSDTGEVVR